MNPGTELERKAEACALYAEVVGCPYVAMEHRRQLADRLVELAEELRAMLEQTA